MTMHRGKALRRLLRIQELNVNFNGKIIERDARDDGKNDGWREQRLTKS